ncbi:MAG: glycoside hydrolase family 2 protein [Solirubrobacteraceae bacterium]
MRGAVEGHERAELSDGWEVAGSDPGSCPDQQALDQLAWRPALVPGGAADVLRAAGMSAAQIAAAPLDQRDWWFRCRLTAAAAAPGEQLVLVFEGLATVAEVFLNGARILTSESMFARSAVDVTGLLRAENELAICCRALTPLLAVSRRPRARWRTRLVSEGALRFFRTMLIGRAPGFAPGPAVVGPWRPIALERRRQLALTELRVRPRLAGDDGILAIRARLTTLAEPAPERVFVELQGTGGSHRCELELVAGAEQLEASGELAVADVARWWPHTHGEPSLYALTLHVQAGDQTLSVDCGRVGFRELGGGEQLEQSGLQLSVNGVGVFVRGAVWTPLEASGPPPSRAQLRSLLETMRAAGMNMVRIPGTAAYESAAFHDLCDELGMLVWQDFMFANLDYPESDPAFLDVVAREGRQLLDDLGGRPSLAVICGSSEVAQQIAMLGLDPALAEGPLYGELLPGLLHDAAVDAIWVPSAPWGGALPFRPDRGVANYYGVGGYRRGLDDVRRSEVRFAAECLAFANVPDQPVLDTLAEGQTAGVAVHDPRWKAGVPRDAGSGWDFDDVRDHYLGSLFEVDPAELRRSDHERYLELSRAVSGEVMSEVFGEWRRGGSPCGGGLVLWLRDLCPGAGWGILDHRGEPKVAYHHLRRVLAPLAVWSTDEGLRGIAVHVANDRPEPARVRLRVALYSEHGVRVEQTAQELELAPHGYSVHDLEEMLGHFVDVSWAYRFGPPAQQVVVCSLERDGGQGVELLSQCFRLPAGRLLAREPAARLGLTATLTPSGEDRTELQIRAQCFVYGVRVHLPGFRAADDAFSIEPGGERRIAVARVDGAPPGADGALTALNLAGRVPIMFSEA